MDQSHFAFRLDERPDGVGPRPRRCLLKGCERLFRPSRPRAHYCGEACREAAKRWRRWRASQRYRETEDGRERRREQCRRYRQRVRERPIEPPAIEPTINPIINPIDTSAADAEPACEGQRAESKPEEIPSRPCSRPGCYELFAIADEHSRKRFCGAACRLALRRVLDRESRHRSRRRRRRLERVNRPARPSDTS